jgi:hypothetical protein
MNQKATLIATAKYPSLSGIHSVKLSIELRVVAIENAVIQPLTISAPLSTENGLLQAV